VDEPFPSCPSIFGTTFSKGFVVLKSAI